MLPARVALGTHNVRDTRAGSAVLRLHTHLIFHKIQSFMAEFGLIGLGVMGKSLSRNLARNGFRLALYNRHLEGVEEDVAQRFIQTHPELKSAKGFHDLAKFVTALERPRKVFLMIKAGKVTDEIINELQPHLAPDDVIIDGGNSVYKNTERRAIALKKVGIHFIGTGVSGGEEGALKGPSVMPGGDATAYKIVQPYLEAIAAKDANGKPCCTHVGAGGAGHFVKMIHNGIEYAEMQLLAELTELLRWHNQLPLDALADVFAEWGRGESNSYLLEITADILRKREGDDFLLNKILDQAGNKGTGGWSTTAASELGVPATMIAAALFARYTSAHRAERLQAAPMYQNGRNAQCEMINLSELKTAYQIARVVNHHQGFHLIHEASERYDWQINLPEVARIWTNGCIIRSNLMENLIAILQNTNKILLDVNLNKFIDSQQFTLNKICQSGLKGNLATPCFQAAYQYLTAYSTARSSANIIQAQRDYFGAHTYRRMDDSEGKSHHTIWKKNSDS